MPVSTCDYARRARGLARTFESAEALAVSVCATVPESTHVAFVLPGSRALSPVDQQCPRLTGGLVQLDLQRIGIPLDKPRESRPILLDRHTTPNLIRPRLAARLRLIHDDHSTSVTRGQADPERRAGHGPRHPIGVGVNERGRSGAGVSI